MDNVGYIFLAGRIEEFLSLNCCDGKMEGADVVSSSSSTTIKNSEKHQIKCDQWEDELCSNINYTKPWYRGEIMKLKAEISKLESSLKLKEDKESFSTAHFNDILVKLIDKLSKDKQDLLEGLDVNGQLNDDGEIDIKRLERFTGLCIYDISLKIGHEKGDVCVRRHDVQGSCRGIGFETVFLVEENTMQDDGHDAASEKEEVSGKLPQIISLEVSIENEAAKLSMKDFLEYVQEEKQLQQFFATLQKYTKWRRDRAKTFKHFQDGYPDLVTHTPLQDATTMTICNKHHPNLRVNIVWKLLVTRVGETKPTFDIQSCFPTQQLDNKGFVRKMRAKFLSLLRNVGIEKSIEVIILTIAK